VNLRGFAAVRSLAFWLRPVGATNTGRALFQWPDQGVVAYAYES